MNQARCQTTSQSCIRMYAFTHHDLMFSMLTVSKLVSGFATSSYGQLRVQSEAVPSLLLFTPRSSDCRSNFRRMAVSTLGASFEFLQSTTPTVPEASRLDHHL